MGESLAGTLARAVGSVVSPLLTSPIHQRPADLPQQIVGVIWQDSVPDHDFQKETEDFQRKMIRFGSVLRMSVRRPLFVPDRRWPVGSFQSVVTKAKNGRKLIYLIITMFKLSLFVFYAL